jgi:YbgC/YbaW family acyl-CoA thioester hydrolase
VLISLYTLFCISALLLQVFYNRGAMALTFTGTYRPRHDECDAYGRLRPAHFVRYMQEAAFDASASVGFDFYRYLEMGRAWLAYETEVEFLAPVRYRESLAITTWIGDWRRVRSLRLYELRRVGTDELVARAQTDWVFLDTTSMQPTQITPEMVAAYSDPNAPQAPPRRRFAALTPPETGVFVHQERVGWRDIDTAWHVNNAAYCDYLDEAARQADAQGGWTAERWKAAGAFPALRRLNIEYRQAAVYGETLDVLVWTTEADAGTVSRDGVIRRAGDGALIAQAHAVWGCIDAMTGAATTFPSDYIASAAPTNSGANS